MARKMTIMLLAGFVLVGLVTGACAVHAEEPASPPRFEEGTDAKEYFVAPKHFPALWDAGDFYCHGLSVLVNTARYATTDPDYAKSFPVYSATTLERGYSIHSALQQVGTELAEHEEWQLAHAVAELTTIANPDNADDSNFQTGIIHGRRMARLCGSRMRTPYSADAITEYICGGTVSSGRSKVSPPGNCQ